MSEAVLLSKAGRTQGHASELSAAVADSVDLVRERAGGRNVVWIASGVEDLDLLSELNAHLVELNGDHRLVVRGKVGRGRAEVLRASFRYVISADDQVMLLPFAQLVEVVTSADRKDLLIGLAVDPQDRALVLFRGNLEPLVAPMSFFGVKPAMNPPDFEVIEYGQGIRAGEFEASTDSVLYALDPDYRKRKKALWVKEDASFGGALRRLRILRNLSRLDFEGVSAKEIGRIERGEINRPHGKTLEIVAMRLGVRPDEIASY